MSHQKMRTSIQSLRLVGVDIGHEPELPLMHNLTWECELGKNYVIRGAGGVGKSTFLRTLAALMPVRGGQYFINESSVSDFSFEEFMPLRANIGYGFGVSTLLSNRTIQENLQLPVFYNREMSPEKFETFFVELATRFDFLKYRYIRPHGVPLSVQKIVTVLRAFMRRPEIVILDEPFSGLSSSIKQEFVRFLEEKASSGEVRTFFISTDETALLGDLETTELWLSDKELRVVAGEKKLQVVGA